MLSISWTGPGATEDSRPVTQKSIFDSVRNPLLRVGSCKAIEGDGGCLRTWEGRVVPPNDGYRSSNRSTHPALTLAGPAVF
jgi:hypothetical protein